MIRLKNQPLMLHQATLYAFGINEASKQQEHLTSLLSPDELRRANRFLVPEARNRFIICRGKLRQILGQTLDVEPRTLRFDYGQWGKPTVNQDDMLAGEIHFNVSHSGDYGVIVLSNQPIGVDIETIDRQLNPQVLAGQVLSQRESQAWKSIPPGSRQDELLRLWVSKEALLKAIGLGIADVLPAVTMPIPLPASFNPQAIAPELLLRLDDDASCRMNSWIDANTWLIHRPELVKGATMAIATMRSVDQLKTVWLD